MGIFNALIGAGAKAVEGGAEGVKYLATQQLDKNLKLDLAKEMAEIDMQKQLRIDEVTGRRNTQRQKELSRFKEELRTNAPDFKLGMEQKEQSMDLAQQSFDLEKLNSKSRRDADKASIEASNVTVDEKRFALNRAQKDQKILDNIEKLTSEGKIEEANKQKQLLRDRFKILNPGESIKYIKSLTQLIESNRKILTDDDSGLDTEEKNTLLKEIKSYSAIINSLTAELYPEETKKNSQGLLNPLLRNNPNFDPNTRNSGNSLNADLNSRIQQYLKEGKPLFHNDGSPVKPGDFFLGSDQELYMKNR